MARIAWLVPIADRNGDDKLDRKELDAWLDLQTQIARGQVLLTVLDGAGLFEFLDSNHDGALSLRELRTAWDRLKNAACVTDGAFDPKKLPRTLLVAASQGYPQTLAARSAVARRGFGAMDKNGDGDVSRKEFTGPAEVFDKLDLEKDGLLSVEEANKAEVRRRDLPSAPSYTQTQGRMNPRGSSDLIPFLGRLRFRSKARRIGWQCQSHRVCPLQRDGG